MTSFKFKLTMTATGETDAPSEEAFTRQLMKLIHAAVQAVARKATIEGEVSTERPDEEAPCQMN